MPAFVTMRNAIRFFWLSILALGMVLPATAQTTSRVSFEQGQGEVVASSVQLCPPNNIVLTQGQYDVVILALDTEEIMEHTRI